MKGARRTVEAVDERVLRADEQQGDRAETRESGAPYERGEEEHHEHRQLDQMHEARVPGQVAGIDQQAEPRQEDLRHDGAAHERGQGGKGHEAVP